MQGIWLLLTYAAAAGLAIPLGGLLAAWENFRSGVRRQQILHGVTAFGGGALLAAVALSIPAFAITFLAGAVLFMELNRRLQRRQGTGAQVVAMMADFLPEAVALGATFAHHSASAPLLALLIALQNVPEGFNAFRELALVSSRRTALWAMCGLAALGPAAAAVGYALLFGSDAAVSGVMVFAAGGILYLTFQEIAPASRFDQGWLPPLGAVGGFLLGVVGKMAIG